MLPANYFFPSSLFLLFFCRDNSTGGWDLSIWKLDLRSSGYATQAVAEKTDIYRIFLLHLGRRFFRTHSASYVKRLHSQSSGQTFEGMFLTTGVIRTAPASNLRLIHVVFLAKLRHFYVLLLCQGDTVQAILHNTDDVLTTDSFRPRAVKED